MPYFQCLERQILFLLLQSPMLHASKKKALLVDPRIFEATLSHVHHWQPTFQCVLCRMNKHFLQTFVEPAIFCCLWDARRQTDSAFQCNLCSVCASWSTIWQHSISCHQGITSIAATKILFKLKNSLRPAPCSFIRLCSQSLMCLNRYSQRFHGNLIGTYPPTKWTSVQFVKTAVFSCCFIMARQTLRVLRTYDPAFFLFTSWLFSTTATHALAMLVLHDDFSTFYISVMPAFLTAQCTVSRTFESSTASTKRFFLYCVSPWAFFDGAASKKHSKKELICLGVSFQCL